MKKIAETIIALVEFSRETVRVDGPTTIASICPRCDTNKSCETGVDIIKKILGNKSAWLVLALATQNPDHEFTDCVKLDKLLKVLCILQSTKNSD